MKRTVVTFGRGSRTVLFAISTATGFHRQWKTIPDSWARNKAYREIMKYSRGSKKGKGLAGNPVQARDGTHIRSQSHVGPGDEKTEEARS